MYTELMWWVVNNTYIFINIHTYIHTCIYNMYLYVDSMLNLLKLLKCILIIAVYSTYIHTVTLCVYLVHVCTTHVLGVV